MSILNFFENHGKKQNKEYFAQLVSIALADHVITSDEKEMLYRIGNKIGFSDPEIDHIIEKAVRTDYIPPYELSKRFEQVYDVVKMILADGVIDPNEMRLASGFALKSDFKETEIPVLLDLLINGINQGKDEEDLFKDYLKVWRSRNK